MIDEAQISSRKRIAIYKYLLALFMQLFLLVMILLMGFGTDESHWAFGLSLLALFSLCTFIVIKIIFRFDWILGPGLKYGIIPSDKRSYLETANEGVSIAAGIKTPELVCIDYDFTNAFSMEKFGDSSIYLTRGLIETLGKKELEAVIAHEIAHIRNGDVSIPHYPVQFNLAYIMLLLNALFKRRLFLFITVLLLISPLITYAIFVDISNLWEASFIVFLLFIFVTLTPLRIIIDPRSNPNLVNQDYLADKYVFRWTLDPESLVLAIRSSRANGLYKKLDFLKWVTFVPISDRKRNSYFFEGGTIQVPTAEERIEKLGILAHYPL